MPVPSYVLNFDELSDLLKDYLSNGINVDMSNTTFNTTNLENILRDIEGKIQGVNYNDLITALNALGVKLDSLTGSIGLSGVQRMYGKMLEMTSSNTNIVFPIPASGKITGISYSLSSWNYQDSWDLLVDDVKLFTEVRTKEYGEHKYFNVYYPVTAGQNIIFKYNNISGNNRILWVDFNILENS